MRERLFILRYGTCHGKKERYIFLFHPSPLRERLVYPYQSDGWKVWIPPGVERVPFHSTGVGKRRSEGVYTIALGKVVPVDTLSPEQ